MKRARSTHRSFKKYISHFGYKPEGKERLCKPNLKWEDNIRIDFKKIGCEYVDWMHLAQDRDQWRALSNTVMNVRVPF